MSDIKVGMYVKDRTKKYAPVGVVIELLGDGSQAAAVQFTDAYGRERGRTDPIKIDNLIHICNRNTGSGFERSMCGRPVKEGNLCGIHAAADRRVKENREREQKVWEDARRKRAERAQLQAQMEQRINRLDMIARVSVQDPERDTVTLPLTALEELIARDRNR